ncbi:hypothetical protein Btru_041710 [Bulinus truncatus]|nr:hypothetical protein Btru_041710 [Bulinus truncatus]
MNFLGFIFVLRLTLWSLGLTTVTKAVSNSVQEVLGVHCDRPRHNSVTATSELQTTTVNMSPTPRSASNSSSGMDRETECDVWYIKSEDDQSEIVVLINSLHLASRDLFFLFSDSDQTVLRYDHNVTQHKMELFPKDMKSAEPFTLIWIHYPLLIEVDVSTKQRLAFSYWIRESKASLAEKEKVVMMGAIVISIFTVIATLISITRATKCHCIRNTWTFLKARERDRCTGGNSHSHDASGEIVSLMMADIPAGRCLPYQDSGDHRCEVGLAGPDQATTAAATARSPEPGAPSDVTLAAHTTAVESERRSNQSLAHVTHDDLPTTPSQSMSALLGLLPQVPARPAAASPRPLHAQSQSFRFLTYLLPSRLRHVHGAPRGPPIYLTSPASPTMPPGGGGAATAGGRRMSAPHARVSSTASRHFSPFQHLQSSVNSGAQGGTGSAAGPVNEVPPPYSDVPPPSYSVLFPDNT